MSDLADVLDFCPGCFATNEDGSWGHTCDDHYCYNCGAQGTVKLPRWAVRSIREQASWVGKRYYPHDEDREAAEEAPLSVEPERDDLDYAIALQRAIEYHCRGWDIPPEIARSCPYHAKKLNDSLPPARQPGADAELVERLRAASNGDLNDFRTGGAERTVDEMMTLCAQAADAIARLSAPAGPGSEGGEAIWWARMEYLFEALPFVVRHRWGGDAREMVEGLDAARAAREASGADHHDAGTGET